MDLKNIFMTENIDHQFLYHALLSFCFLYFDLFKLNNIYLFSPVRIEGMAKIKELASPMTQIQISRVPHEGKYNIRLMVLKDYHCFTGLIRLNQRIH